MARKIDLNDPEEPDFQDPIGKAELTERANRLRSAVQEAGGNAAVAARASLPVGTLNRYLGGRDMKTSYMVAFAEACDISVEWLATGQGPRRRGQQSEPTRMQAKAYRGGEISRQADDDIAQIPFYTMQAAINFGLFDSPNHHARSFAISKRFLKDVLSVSPDRVVMIRTSGDGMSPTINSGDTLLVDMTPANLLVGVHVMVLNRGLILKRLSSKSAGTILISSDNPIYPAEEIKSDRLMWGQNADEDALWILGRVLYRFQGLS